jgi:hypothetical protein
MSRYSRDIRNIIVPCHMCPLCMSHVVVRGPLRLGVCGRGYALGNSFGGLYTLRNGRPERSPAPLAHSTDEVTSRGDF